MNGAAKHILQETDPCTLKGNSGLPQVEVIEIEMPSEVWAKGLDKVIDRTNDFMFQVTEDTYPPIVRREGKVIYVPKYSVIYDTMVRSITIHQPPECILHAHCFLNKLHEQVGMTFNVWEFVSACADEAESIFNG